MNAEELFAWYKSNKQNLPKESFQLNEYTKVEKPAIFYQKIEKDIADYPDVFGANKLLKHLKELHQLSSQ